MLKIHVRFLSVILDISVSESADFQLHNWNTLANAVLDCWWSAILVLVYGVKFIVVSSTDNIQQKLPAYSLTLPLPSILIF